MVLFWRKIMSLYLYADKSGVFDKVNKDYFVYDPKSENPSIARRI